MVEDDLLVFGEIGAHPPDVSNQFIRGSLLWPSSYYRVNIIHSSDDRFNRSKQISPGMSPAEIAYFADYITKTVFDLSNLTNGSIEVRFVEAKLGWLEGKIYDAGTYRASNGIQDVTDEEDRKKDLRDKVVLFVESGTEFERILAEVIDLQHPAEAAAPI